MEILEDHVLLAELVEKFRILYNFKGFNKSEKDGKDFIYVIFNGVNSNENSPLQVKVLFLLTKEDLPDRIQMELFNKYRITKSVSDSIFIGQIKDQKIIHTRQYSNHVDFDIEKHLD